MAVGCGITDLQHRVAESGATIFLALVEKCRSADRRAQHFEFVGKARSIVVELGWFVWIRSHLAYIIETMCAIATINDNYRHYLSFSTKVSISCDVTLDPSDPFRTPFVISNDSYLPISDVTFSCTTSNIQPNEFVDAFPRDQEGRVPRLGAWGLKPGPRYVADYLQPNEKRRFECLSMIGLLKHPITSASVEIITTYRPLWILWKQERQFKFDTQRNKDGQLIWLPPRHY